RGLAGMDRELRSPDCRGETPWSQGGARLERVRPRPRGRFRFGGHARRVPARAREPAPEAGALPKARRSLAPPRKVLETSALHCVKYSIAPRGGRRQELAICTLQRRERGGWVRGEV